MVSEMMGTISKCAQDDRGFSLIESMIAIGVLAVGLLSVAAGFASGMQQMTGSNFDFIAREKAAEAIESVFTARDTRTITWAMIANVSGETGSDGGVFKDDPQPLKLTGNDGLVNTADDSATYESIPQPGADGLLGTADDTQMQLSSFTREIVIREIGPTLRSLRVVIRYTVGRQTREYIIDTYISSYA
jgi:prepilin-type N-terminal cleavage/methylation domain-containing protein